MLKKRFIIILGASSQISFTEDYKFDAKILRSLYGCPILISLSFGLKRSMAALQMQDAPTSF